MKGIFAEILIPTALDTLFTYQADSEAKIGDVVLVEFGKRKIWGVIFNIAENIDQNLELSKIKKIIKTNSNFSFSLNQIKFINEISSYYLVPRGLVLKAFIGFLNSDKIKKEFIPSHFQQIDCSKFLLKKLSQQQEIIAKKLSELADRKKFEVALLDGITGSGKTEVYFSVIAEILAKNQTDQILILLPEIALTSQLMMRFREQFGFDAVLWHSKISVKNRREIFHSISSGSSRIIIGARSALLLPFKNLKLIIVDEEHDESLKQEEGFNFHARDMAIMMANIEKFLVILSSATPSLESMQNALVKKFHYFALDQKYGSINQVELIDLKQQKLKKNSSLSERLISEISENLNEKKQTLLFLNRRGHSLVSLCIKCGQKSECLNCDANLVYHKNKNLMICHYCGHQEDKKNICSKCNSQDSIISLGVGIEKLSQQVSQIFPQARIAVFSSDDVGDFKKTENLIKQILNDEIDIIIGTQMISKGHDFKNLSLIGIIDADSMLYSSSIRANEKTFQLLTQVIGRAGRRAEAGKIIIQTYNPDNFLFSEIKKNDKKDFYLSELQNRSNADLPPFSRMAKIEISAFDEKEAKKTAKEIVKNFPVDERIEIFGPAPAIIFRIKNRFCYLLNIKASKKINLSKLIKEVVAKIQLQIKKNGKNSAKIRVIIDPI
jgi:primosomal protein N' (replication factor Y)